MNIIVAHNYYRNRGGEDQVFEDESALLEARGHNVTRFIRRNTDFSGLQTIAVAAGTVWNQPASKALENLVRETDADVVHFHNWMPQISQAAFYGARKGGAAVVQTIHNYRYTCANGVLFRDGDVCELCVGKTFASPAIKYGCYRDSRAATVPVVAALTTHKLLRTADRAMDGLIVLSEFARSKLTEAGLPADKMYVKPNFVSPDPGVRAGDGGYMAFVGRLIDNKGIPTLLDAWNRMDSPPLLKIAGSGPLTEVVAQAAHDNDAIEFLGRVDPTEIPDLFGGASASIVPSRNYEGFPKSIVESFAVGTPVIASDLGSMTEIISVSENGFLVVPGDADDLMQSVSRFPSGDDLTSMRRQSRRAFEDNYGEDRNYDVLLDIYAAAVANRAAR